jgi:small subunit ribosomal protein S1
LSEIQNSSIFSLDDVNEEEMNNLIDGTITDFDEGDLVNGTVVKIEHDEVLVDIGFKSEGVIPVRELSIRKDANPADIVALGDPIEALVLQKEDKDGRLVLSKKRAEYERAWNRIEEKFNSGENVEGEVIEVVKGGLILDIGLRGFLPASLVDLRRVKDLTSYMGTRIEARVIEMDRNRNNVVLSRRVVLEESRKAERSEILSKLELNGLIERSRNPKDRRQLTIRLTETGRENARIDQAARIRFRERAFSALTHDEREDLAEMLDKIRVTWEELDD